jgi:hypothetical protein
MNDATPDDTPIVVYDFENSFALSKTLETWSSLGKKFYLLHIGDAAGLDPIDVYNLPGCLGVVRNYVRPMLPPHVLTVPLGYQYACPEGAVERNLVWSFLGTNWHNRKELLTPLCEIPAHHLHFVDDWASPNKLSPEDMYSYMKRSAFVPCPSGENAESFRIYEALEAGAMPVLVRDSKEFIEFITANLPLKVFDSWDDAAIIMNGLSGAKFNEYRAKVLDAWAIYKNTLNRSVKALFKL